MNANININIPNADKQITRISQIYSQSSSLVALNTVFWSAAEIRTGIAREMSPKIAVSSKMII